MKIVSKFRDFYDSALAFGHDDHTVYVRQTSEYPLKAHWSPKGWIQPDVPAIVKDIVERIKHLTADDIDSSDWDWRHSRSVIMSHFTDKDRTYDSHRFSVLFCGKHYPGLRVSTSKKTPGIPSTTERVDWFYSADDMIAFMASKGVDAEKEMVRRNTSAADGLRDYFADRQLDVDWLIEHKVTAVVYEIYGDRVLINPPLKDYGFFKAVDHYTAFQELDMWISGTLAWPQNMMIELDDKYRVMAHGFDMKYGFRTRPKNER